MIWIILNIVLLIALALSFQPEEGPTKHYWIGLAVKVSCSLTFGWFYYLHLETGDTLMFHQKALELMKLAEESFSQYFDYLITGQYPVFKAESRTDIFTKVLSLPYIATQGNYWLSALYLAFFSFLCSWFLFRSVIRYYPIALIPAFIAFLLFPSPIFWSSGILKDTLTNGSIFFLAGICIRYRHHYSFTFSQVTVAIACLFILFYMKFYLAAVAGVCMGFLAWSNLSHAFIQSKTARSLVNLAALVVLISLVSLLNRNLNYDRLPAAIYSNYQQIASISSHHVIDFSLDGSYTSVLENTPKALVTGLFRPFIWESSSLMLLFGIENVLILALFVANLILIKKWKFNLLIALAILFVLSLAIFLPMASPNMGSLVRYKSVFIPFLAFVLMLTPFEQWFSKKEQFT